MPVSERRRVPLSKGALDKFGVALDTSTRVREVLAMAVLMLPCTPQARQAALGHSMRQDGQVGQQPRPHLRPLCGARRPLSTHLSGRQPRAHRGLQPQG